MRLIYLGAAWLASLLLGQWLRPPWGLLLGLAIPLLLAGFLLSRRWWLGWAGVYLALALLGTLRFQASLPEVDESSLQSYNGAGPIALKGVVSADPDPRGRATYLRLRATEVRVEGKWRQVEGQALAYAPSYPSLEPGRAYPYYRYGDLLQMEGELETPPALPGFNYRDYLARQGIHSLLRYPKDIALLDAGRGLKPMEWVYRLRNSLSQSLGRSLPEPQAALAQGILLGQRSGLPSSLEEDFRRTGTSHIIAISGHNLTIVLFFLAGAAAWALGRHRPYHLLLALAVIWGYSLLVGMPASVVRAAIMGSLWLLAQFLGRPGAAGPALVLAAAVMAGINPLILGDVAFQLSFAAMASLIYLFPLLQRLGRRAWGRVWGPGDSRLARLVVDGMAITLAATLATAPIIAQNFHRLSLVGVPATFLALPALPAIIVTSAVVGTLGLFLSGAAQAAGWLAWLFLSYMIKVVELFAAIPWASIDIKGVETPVVWAYYGAMAGLAWLAGQKKPLTTLWSPMGGLAQRLPTGKIALALLPLAALAWIAALTLPNDKTHVYFLDVGQGDAILITTPSHQNILIDGGPRDSAILEDLGKRLPFWDRTLDLVVATHHHEDHVGGQVEVLRRYRVDRVLDVGWEGAGPNYQEWRKLVEERGASYFKAERGQLIKLGKGITLEVLHPPQPRLKATGDDIDNNSMVLHLVVGKVSFLLSGDLFQAGEAYLVAQGLDLASAVLKVGHHGADTSTSADFLEAVSPQVAVVSVGANNPFGHPDSQILERLKGVPVYRTDGQGTIEFITDGRRLWLKAER